MPHAFGQGWSSFIDYSPKSGTLVAVTQLGEVMEIWNTKNNSHQVIRGKLGEPKFKMTQDYAIPSGIKGYNDVQVTERAIYAIFAGLSYKEMIGKTQKGINVPEGGMTVRVFSLEGEPLKEYKLDHSVSGIWVDEQAGKMWDNQFNLVFTDALGKYLVRRTVVKHFKKISQRAGISDDARFHDLRHSFAVSSLYAGDDIKTVQANLGHATAQFTLDVYGHVTQKMRQESANRMQKFYEQLSSENAQ